MVHDRGSGPYEDGKPVRPESVAQPVANESWPFQDSKGRHSRGIEDQPADNRRDVWVRLELERDGEVVLEGRAARWNRSHVYVHVNDPRVPRQAVWVRAKDVRPR